MWSWPWSRTDYYYCSTVWFLTHSKGLDTKMDNSVTYSRERRSLSMYTKFTKFSWCEACLSFYKGNWKFNNSRILIVNSISGFMYCSFVPRGMTASHYSQSCWNLWRAWLQAWHNCFMLQGCKQWQTWWFKSTLF